MLQRQYSRWEKILSYVVFAISTVVYLITMETSASVWDCPEFITTFDKLEVGHPPGAPFYMLIYNFFANFFPGSGANVAIAANALSCILSGLTIMILFRTISHLIRRSIAVSEAWTSDTVIAKDRAYLGLGGALVGSLLYAFTDTFWYSAIEAEVYSFSSFFTAIVFYLMLKWEESADDEASDRWLIAIAYLMGLSIGVHLLNLLAIPAMALLYYFKRYNNPNWKGAIITTLASFALIAVVMFGIVQGLPEVAGWFDLFFVNTLGMPFNSGLTIYIIILLTVLVLTYIATMRRPVQITKIRVLYLLSIILMGIPFMGNHWLIPIIIIGALAWYLFRSKALPLRMLNLTTLSMFVFFIGLSTYAVILIRANSDVPMNQNTPSDAFSLRYYLSREQYGSTPLIYGPSYASLPEYNSDGSVKLKSKTVWKRVEKIDPNSKDRYEAGESKDIVYRSDMMMLFPRVYNSTQGHFPEGYKIWSDQTGKMMHINQHGETKSVEVPTFGDNLKYFFSYQINYMYWRYFLWNFSGRQNDILGQGEINKGNWISGISFLDALFLGPQDNQPDSIENNPAHNKYYMLPLILGILGLLFQLNAGRRGRQTFWITFALFFMTGLAIVIYLNQTPYQVRERDYAYAGSFYAFCIWIGFAVPAVYNMIARKKRSTGLVAGVTGVLLLVPVLVFAQNYDDHNRHGRRLAADFGSNYLESCEPNGIIFCNGDNDTFPLWYNQEVEGVRRDLRVCNTSYLQADWYIEQMKKDVYDSKALPISWGLREYGGERRSIVYIIPMVADTLTVSGALDYASSDDPAYKRIPDVAQSVDYIPSSTLQIPYKPSELVAKGAITRTDTAYADGTFLFDFQNKRYLGRQELIILDMLANNNFERPFYYCLTVGESERVGLTPHFRQTGMAYKIMPFKTQGTGDEIDVERMYDNVMNKFKWGGADRKGVYMDENSRNMCETYRSMVFVPLAKALIAKGDKERAQKVLNKCLEAIRGDVVPHTYTSLPLVEQFYKVGDNDHAVALSKEIIDREMKSLRWYFRLDSMNFLYLFNEIERSLMVTNEVLRMDSENTQSLQKAYTQEYTTYEKQYLQIRNQLPDVH